MITTHETHDMTTIGHVMVPKDPKNPEMPGAAPDPAQWDVYDVDDSVWAALEREKLDEEISAIAEGLVARDEEGWFEAPRLAQLVELIERKAAYVSDPALASWLASLRDIALRAEKRGAPVVFRIS